MPSTDHPAWCAAAFCNIDRPPLYGHRVGAHRSTPQVVEATVVRLRQVDNADPAVEIQRGDVRLVLPLDEARAVPLALDALLEASGIEL